MCFSERGDIKSREAATLMPSLHCVNVYGDSAPHKTEQTLMPSFQCVNVYEDSALHTTEQTLMPSFQCVNMYEDSAPHTTEQQCTYLASTSQGSTENLKLKNFTDF